MNEDLFLCEESVAENIKNNDEYFKPLIEQYIQETKDILASLDDSEDLLDEQSSKVEYEIWAIGYDENDQITDTEILLNTFSNIDEAVQSAKKITLDDIKEKYTELNNAVAYFSVEVESVVDLADDCRQNIGTLYRDFIIYR